MLQKLPGWVVDDAESVREEVARFRDTTPSERWRLAHLCAEDVLWTARVGGDRRRALELADALPESTVEALRRLRREAGWGDGDG